MATGFTGLGSLLDPGVSSLSQDQLVEMATAGLAPAGQALNADRLPAPIRFPGLRLPTLRQLGALDDDELRNLNTYYVQKYNVQVPSVARQSQRQFAGGGFGSPTQMKGIGL